ncbi:TMhelix containing protein [Vibrio phage 2.117.O._10N.261.45.E9]|nr:TMhelix containing protein [Vibrio phage 1.117.O._10N.261.45.E9]AUR95446.1 TMhelix containing protein [Vibrio phage 1.207.B._10N.222.51.C2]AUS02337.1 TMhelix containing protein [Vibrio phage 2.117.O._10N.261.45.E9]
MFVAFVVAFAVSLVVSFAMAPSTQSQPAAGLGDFKAPTAEDGREIPVLFGTKEITGSNTVWYGDLRTEAIRK